MAVIIVGHVTKEGAIAGPRVLEHLVDTVVYFEGEPGSSIRVLRALKNRFGPTNEIGVFAMGETGLRPVPNPSALFMAQHERAGAGAVLFAAIEGSRPLLVQVQALVDRSAATPRRVCTGFDSQRLAMLLAVMNRHLGLELGGYDVFVNVVGGLRVTEPAADLPIVLAVWSSLTMRSLPQGLATFGEVGLGGEVRPVVGGMLRLGEADKLGVTHVIGASSGARAQSQLQRTHYAAVRSVGEALDALKAMV
jgi:DNA repair protein RadA/Sms